MVGTKSDLRSDEEIIDYVNRGKGIIHSKYEGIEMAKKHRCIGYCETSAKLGIGLKECFETAIVAASHQKDFKKKENCILQ